MEQQSEDRAAQENQAHADEFLAIDCGAGSPMSDDLSLSGLLDFDGLIEPLSPLIADPFFSSFTYSSLHPIGNYASLISPVALEQARDSIQEDAESSHCGCFRFSQKIEASKHNFQPEFSLSPTNEIEFELEPSDCQIDSAQKDAEGITDLALKCVSGSTFSDRMLSALSILKESSGGGILAQFWIPIKQGDHCMLSTSEQPFLLDQALAGYREVSRVFTFSTKEAPGILPGVPGRVFISGLPEWTSNVMYYTRHEYLRADYAVSHDVRGSLAVPIFFPNKSACCAVLELVTTKEKPDFSIELENVCKALQAVDLSMTKENVHHQVLNGNVDTLVINLTKDQKSAVSEILSVLRTVCHTHMLPLALTWMPVVRKAEIIDEGCKTMRYLKETVLCVQELASYANDSQMHGFLQACTKRYLAKGQGIAGKAFISNHPFFSPDVKSYGIGEYPLAHHARKFGLQAAVAIRLRSTYTGDDDYILELFLPVNCQESAEQQLLLNNLSVTMQHICRSLRTVLDVEAARPDVSEVDTKIMEEENSHSSEISARNSQLMFDANSLMFNSNKGVADISVIGLNLESDEQVNYGFQKPRDKKRITSLKHISLNVLQKYFAGSLKDAAKSLGVCPTTLKRICRLHGISRWPSRKIKKVNHSLKKIQSVISSVHGAEGTLKYDMKTGCLVASVPPQNKPPITPSSTDNADTPLSRSLRCEVQQLDGKLEQTSNNQPMPKSSNSAGDDAVHFKLDKNVHKEHSHPSISSMTDSSGEGSSSCKIFKESTENEPFVTKKGTIYVVKATYKADIVRFKLLPSMDFLHLYEELGKRFKLCSGTFQLKYMDDEEEWIMLTSDSDLQECIEVLQTIASQCIKLQVHDVLCAGNTPSQQ